MQLKTLATTLSALLLSATLSAAPIQWVDRIAIVVNQDIITERDIVDIQNSQPQSLRANPQDSRQAAIDELIDRKVVLQLGQRNGVHAADYEINATLMQIAAAQKMSLNDFYRALVKDGISREVLRRTVAENIIIRKVTEEEMMHLVPVSQEEIMQFLADNPPPMQRPEYRLEIIAIRGDVHLRDEDQQRLKKLRQQAQQGAIFSRLVDGQTSRLRYQPDMQWQVIHDANLADALENIAVGKITDVLPTADGWQMAKLNAKRIVDTPREEIIKQAHRQLAIQKSGHLRRAWLDQLRQQAYIEDRSERPY